MAHLAQGHGYNKKEKKEHLVSITHLTHKNGYIIKKEHRFIRKKKKVHSVKLCK